MPIGDPGKLPPHFLLSITRIDFGPARRLSRVRANCQKKILGRERSARAPSVASSENEQTGNCLSHRSRDPPRKRSAVRRPPTTSFPRPCPADRFRAAPTDAAETGSLNLCPKVQDRTPAAGPRLLFRRRFRKPVFLRLVEVREKSAGRAGTLLIMPKRANTRDDGKAGLRSLPPKRDRACVAGVMPQSPNVRSVGRAIYRFAAPSKVPSPPGRDGPTRCRTALGS